VIKNIVPLQNKLLLFLFSISFCFFACNQKNLIDEVFNHEEAETIYKIIDFYDAFVLSKTDTNLPIDKAYIVFLNNNLQLAIDSGDFYGDVHLLIPSDEYLIPFRHSLSIKHLKVFFVDSVFFFSRKQENFYKYLPDVFATNNYGKYANFLRKMSEKNKFYRQFYESGIRCGDIIYCPTIYVTLIYEYNEIDFRKKDERLIFIIPFLFLNKPDFVDNI